MFSTEIFLVEMNVLRFQHLYKSSFLFSATTTMTTLENPNTVCESFAIFVMCLINTKQMNVLYRRAVKVTKDQNIMEIGIQRDLIVGYVRVTVILSWFYSKNIKCLKDSFLS